MTTSQKKTIETEFNKYPNNDNEKWAVVYERTLIKSKFEISEKILQLYFREQRQPYNICRLLKISKSNFYYHLSNLYETSYLFAHELNLL